MNILYNIIISEPFIFFYILLYVTCDIILNSNPKSQNKKIGRKEKEFTIFNLIEFKSKNSRVKLILGKKHV